MNKLGKIIISILGGSNNVMSILIPILIALMLINTTAITGLNAFVILAVASLSSIFRSIKPWIEY